MSLWKIFKRITFLGDAVANEQVTKLENNNAGSMMQKAIDVLNENYAAAKKALVTVKADEIRKRTEAQIERDKAAEYKEKANKYLDLIESKDVSEKDGELAAQEAATMHDECTFLADKAENEAELLSKKIHMLDEKIQKLKKDIEEAKNKARDIESRKTIATATNAINEQLSDSGELDNARNLIDRMNAETETLEYKGQAYDEIEQGHQSATEKLDELLEKNKTSDSLAAIKAERAKKATTPVS